MHLVCVRPLNVVCLNGPEVSAGKACQKRGCGPLDILYTCVNASVSMTVQIDEDDQCGVGFSHIPLSQQVNNLNPRH